MTTRTIEERARRLVAEVAETGREEPAAGSATARSVTDLYERLRDHLAELAPEVEVEEAAEALALTVYLTRSAEGGESPGFEELSRLKSRIEAVLREWGREGTARC